MSSKKAPSTLLGKWFNRFKKLSLDNEAIDALDDALIESDMPIALAEQLLQKAKKADSPSIAGNIIQTAIKDQLDKLPNHAISLSNKPTVILLFGINGSGKTTLAVKLAHRFKHQGKKVLLAAADTFRAAAVEQLLSWSATIDVPCVTEGKNSAAVVYRAIEKGHKEDFDIVICDTSGRLPNNANLMAELEKIILSATKVHGNTPEYVWLALDGTTGKYAIDQIEQFGQCIPLNGLCLNKIDGASKSGAILANSDLPIHFLGNGEQLEDLLPFSSTELAKHIFPDQ